MTTPTSQLTNEEYNRLVNILANETAIKNTLLTFSFTAVLTVIGVALGAGLEKIHPLVYLVPFFLILPFTARISYYRLMSAHIISFLKVFAPDKMIFPIGTKVVPERHGISYHLIAWLVNHEMFLLSVATTVTFWVAYYSGVSTWTLRDALFFVLPLPLNGLILWISDSVCSYKRLCNMYTFKWHEYLRQLESEGKQNA